MVDRLGLKLIEQTRIDKVMWSSDYPRTESTFGYSDKSPAAVVGSAGAHNAARIATGNNEKIKGV